MQQSFNRFKAEEVCVKEPTSCLDCLVDLGACFFRNHTFKTEVEYFIQKHRSETLHMGGKSRLLLYVTLTRVFGAGLGSFILN